MTIRIDTIGSHGKARVLSYGHPGVYSRPAPLVKNGFRKLEWHWDENLYEALHEPYPLSSEEEAEKQAIFEATPEQQIKVLKERIDELEYRTTALIEPK